ncbi:MAG: N-terminal phage integrase SAM-like domain-containing protein [Chloroflexi bacterium]|nr:N-terminal phage integrase SAM-like domain-containing protein [Chloroflexota bacterium]
MARRAKGEGSVYQHRDGRWVGLLETEGKRKYVYGKTKTEARTELRKIVRDEDEGILITGRDQTFSQYLAAWLRNSVKPTVRVKTYESYECQVRVHITPELGKNRLRKLSAQHLQAFYALKLEEGLASSSVNRQHAIIHRALVLNPARPTHTT